MTKKNSKEMPISVESVDEAKKIIYEKTKHGINTRDIVKIEFDINGILKKFNPYQIKKVKEKFETPKPNNKNQDKTILFELFEKDYTVIKAVIETKLDPKFVNETWIEYLEIKNLRTIPKSSYDQLILRGRKIKHGCNSIEGILDALDQGYDCITELNRFYFPCKNCGVPVILDEEVICDTIRWMQSQWNCGNH